MTSATSSLPAGDGSPYLTTEEASRFLKLPASTLENWRSLGIGPRYRKHGRRVVYWKPDLIAWSDEQVKELPGGE